MLFKSVYPWKDLALPDHHVNFKFMSDFKLCYLFLDKSKFMMIKLPVVQDISITDFTEDLENNYYNKGLPFWLIIIITISPTNVTIVLHVINMRSVFPCFNVSTLRKQLEGPLESVVLLPMTSIPPPATAQKIQKILNGKDIEYKV